MSLPWNRRRRDRELDEELRAHMRMAIEERVARGERREDAERAARREFGNAWRRKGGDARDVGRRVVRAPRAGHSLRRADAAPVAGVHDRRRAHARARDRRDDGDVHGRARRPASPVAVPAIRSARPALLSEQARRMSVAGARDGGRPVDGASRPRAAVRRVWRRPTASSSRSRMRATRCGFKPPASRPRLFETLGVAPLHGRAFARSDETPGGERVVVLGDALWRERFGADRASSAERSRSTACAERSSASCRPDLRTLTTRSSGGRSSCIPASTSTQMRVRDRTASCRRDARAGCGRS